MLSLNTFPSATYVHVRDERLILTSPVQEGDYWFDLCIYCDPNDHSNVWCPFFMRAWQMELDGDLDWDEDDN